MRSSGSVVVAAVTVGVLAGAFAGAGCRSDEDLQTIDAARTIDAPDKARDCTGVFGTGLPVGFGRIDGTVLAVVPPGYQCPLPNRTHLIIEVQTAAGVYRMVVDVLSNQGNPNVFFHELDARLAGDAWADGWHPAQQLDYPTTLGIHTLDFVETREADLVEAISAQIDLGARISIFATVGDESDSAHLVHKQTPNGDGAIVVHPDTAPHYLTLRFDEQLF